MTENYVQNISVRRRPHSSLSTPAHPPPSPPTTRTPPTSRTPKRMQPSIAQTPSTGRKRRFHTEWTREGEGAERHLEATPGRRTTRRTQKKRGRLAADEARELDASRAHSLQRRALLPVSLTAAATEAAARDAVGGLVCSPYALSRCSTIDRELWATAYVRRASEAPARAGHRAPSHGTLFVWSLLATSEGADGINAPLGASLSAPSVAAEIDVRIGADLDSSAQSRAITIGHVEDPRMGAPLVRVFRSGGGRGIFALLRNGCHFVRYEPDDALALLSSRDGGGYLGDERAAARTPFPSRSRGTARWGTARGRCVDCLEPQIVVPEEFFVDMCVVAGGSDDGVDGSAASDGSNGGGEGSASHGAFRVIAATSEGRFFLFIIDPRCASDEDVVVTAPLDSLSAHFGGLRAVAAHIGEDPNEDEDDLDAAAVAAAGEGGGWFSWLTPSKPNALQASRTFTRVDAPTRYPIDQRPGATLIAACVQLLPVTGGPSGRSAFGSAASSASSSITISSGAARSTAVVVLQNFGADGEAANGAAGEGSVGLDVWAGEGIPCDDGFSGGSGEWSERYDPSSAERRVKWSTGGFGRDLHARVTSELFGGGGSSSSGSASVAILDAQMMGGDGAISRSFAQNNARHAVDEAVLALLVACHTDGLSSGSVGDEHPSAFAASGGDPQPSSEVRYALVLVAVRDRAIAHVQPLFGGDALQIERTHEADEIVSESRGLQRCADGFDGVAIRPNWDGSLRGRPSSADISLVGSDPSDVALFYCALPQLGRVTYVWARWSPMSVMPIAARMREVCAPCQLAPVVDLTNAIGFDLPNGRAELIVLVPSTHANESGVLSFKALLADESDLAVVTAAVVEASSFGEAAGGHAASTISADMHRHGAAAESAEKAVTLLRAELLACLEIYERGNRSPETVERVVQRLRAVDERARTTHAIAIAHSGLLRLWARAALGVSEDVVDRVERSWATVGGGGGGGGGGAATKMSTSSVSQLLQPTHAMSGRQLLYAVLQAKRSQHSHFIELLRKVDLWGKIGFTVMRSEFGDANVSCTVWEVLAVHAEKLVAATALCGLLLPESSSGGEGNIVIVRATDDAASTANTAALDRLPRLAHSSSARPLRLASVEHRRVRDEILLRAMLDVVDGVESHDVGSVGAASSAMVESAFFSSVTRVHELIPALLRRAKPHLPSGGGGGDDSVVGDVVGAAEKHAAIIGRYGVLGVVHATLMSAVAYRELSSGREFDMTRPWQLARGGVGFTQFWETQGADQSLLDCVQGALNFAAALVAELRDGNDDLATDPKLIAVGAEVVELASDLGNLLLDGREADVVRLQQSRDADGEVQRHNDDAVEEEEEESAVFFRCDLVEEAGESGGGGDTPAIVTLRLFQASHHRSQRLLRASLPWAGSEDVGPLEEGDEGEGMLPRFFLSLYRARDLALISLDNEIVRCEELDLCGGRGVVGERAFPSEREASLGLQIKLKSPLRFIADYEVEDDQSFSSVVAIMRPCREAARYSTSKRLQRRRGVEEMLPTAESQQAALEFAASPAAKRVRWLCDLRTAAAAAASGAAGDDSAVAGAAAFLRVAAATKAEACAQHGGGAVYTYSGVNERTLLSLSKLALLAATDSDGAGGSSTALLPDESAAPSVVTVKTEAGSSLLEARSALTNATDVVFELLWPKNDEAAACRCHPQDEDVILTPGAPPPEMIALTIAERFSHFDIMLRWAEAQQQRCDSRFDEADDVNGSEAVLPLRVRKRLKLDKLVLRRFLWEHGAPFAEHARKWIQQKIATAVLGSSESDRWIFTLLTLPHADDYNVEAGGGYEPPITLAFEGELRRTSANANEPPASSTVALKPVLFNAEIALLAKLRELQRRGITGEAPLEVCEALLTIRDSDFVQMAAQEALALFFAWRARSGAWPPLKPALYAEIYCRVVTVDIELWEKAAEGGGATKSLLQGTLLGRTLFPDADFAPFPVGVSCSTFLAHLRSEVFQLDGIGGGGGGRLEKALTLVLSGNTAKARRVCDLIAKFLLDEAPAQLEAYFATRRGSSLRAARGDGRQRGLRNMHRSADRLWATYSGSGGGGRAGEI